MRQRNLIDELLVRQRGMPLQTLERMAEDQRRQSAGVKLLPWAERYPESKPPRVHGHMTDAQLFERTHEYELDLSWRTQGRPNVYRGVAIELFRLATLAQALGRKADTLRHWEANQWLPSSSVMRIKGQRRYEGRQILLAQLIAQEEGLLDSFRHSPDGTDFYDRLRHAWMSVPDEDD